VSEPSEQVLGTFPFGRPLRPCLPTADGPRGCFLLGAYPSALHIRWTPLEGSGRRVKALAVDNEPEPFWNGADGSERVAAWQEAVGWRARFGEPAPADKLNGSSGRAVEREWLAPIGIDRSEVWLTDCLDTHHLSEGMREAIDQVYAPFAEAHDLPVANLPRHPDTRAIVHRAQVDRLRAELETARPEILVTLGNAALEVMRTLLASDGPTSLVPDADYGLPIETDLGGRSVAWYALVHPGQRAEEWRGAHASWMARVSQ
jgi:uracil-DNA glycosylase